MRTKGKPISITIPVSKKSAMNEKPPEKWTPRAMMIMGNTRTGTNFNASSPITSKKNIFKPID